MPNPEVSDRQTGVFLDRFCQGYIKRNFLANRASRDRNVERFSWVGYKKRKGSFVQATFDSYRMVQWQGSLCLHRTCRVPTTKWRCEQGGGFHLGDENHFLLGVQDRQVYRFAGLTHATRCLPGKREIGRNDLSEGQRGCRSDLARPGFVPRMMNKTILQNAKGASVQKGVAIEVGMPAPEPTFRRNILVKLAGNNEVEGCCKSLGKRNPGSLVFDGNLDQGRGQGVRVGRRGLANFVTQEFRQCIHVVFSMRGCHVLRPGADGICHRNLACAPILHLAWKRHATAAAQLRKSGRCALETFFLRRKSTPKLRSPKPLCPQRRRSCLKIDDRPRIAR